MIPRCAFQLFCFLILSSVCFGAKPEGTDAERLDASLAKWKTLKEECGGNYTLKFVQSFFTGSRLTTTLVVKNNVVVERIYEEFIRQPDLPVKPGEAVQPAKPTWVETGKDIGSHKGGPAAPVRTLDELYAEAKKLVAMEPPANHVRSLGFDKQGLLNYCFLRDRRIADDAPLTGVRPFTIELSKKP